MKRHPAWLAAGLLILVVLACNLGKKSTSTGSSTVVELHMAKDNGSGDPGDESETFNPSDRTIHCVVKLADAKSGTKMKFTWWIVDAEGSKNERVKEIDYTTRALENVVHAHLTLPQDWPKGKYKVEIYVNGALERTVGYMVV